MKTNKIIRILRKANEWRRGGEGEIPNTTDFGFAIDKSCERLTQYEQMINSMKETKKSLIEKINQKEKDFGIFMNEYKFINLQKQYYETMIDEVEVLLNDKIQHSSIKSIIKNGKERANIDKIIHYNYNNGDIK